MAGYHYYVDVEGLYHHHHSGGQLLYQQQEHGAGAQQQDREQLLLAGDDPQDLNVFSLKKNHYFHFLNS